MEIHYNPLKDIRDIKQTNPSNKDDDFFDLDLEIKERNDKSPTQNLVSEGHACSATCASCAYTCGNCASYQRIC